MSGASTRLLVSAYNVHQGGGQTLLKALLATVPPELPTIVWVDSRLPSAEVLPSHVEIRPVEATLRSRLEAERQIARAGVHDATLLCFGNLPPLWPSRCRSVSVLLQNRLLLEPAALANYPFRVRWRLRLERYWLLRRQHNATRFLVQTPTMRQLALRTLSARTDVVVMPFAAAAQAASTVSPKAVTPMQGEARFDFIYVASGEPHKNHRALVDAWVLLAAEGLLPSLALTLDPTAFPELATWIGDQAAAHGLRITLTGHLTPAGVAQAYQSSNALIYPSLVESFGLPLLEARAHGLPVLAAERDYVRDVIVPTETFDPMSPRSICRAVKRHLGRAEPPTLPLSPPAFLHAVLQEREPA